MNNPTRSAELEATATHLADMLECPTCGASDLHIQPSALSRAPVRCWRCGDHIGTLAELCHAVDGKKVT